MSRRSDLDREQLFSAELSSSGREAIELLSRLDQLTQRQKASGEASAELQALAQATYAELLTRVAPTAAEEGQPNLGAPEELRGRFAESVLMWMQFCKTSSIPLLDSLGTSALRAFPLDLPPDSQAFSRLERALVASLSLEPRASSEAKQRVTHLTSALPLKLSLTEALASLLSAGGAAPNRYIELIQRFYGPLPLRPGDVDFILTSTGIFFVLPVAGERLDVPDWELRPDSERTAIQTFLLELAGGNLTETWRFPAFGLLDPDKLDPRLIEELSELTRVRPDVVQRTLVTMISILPKSEINQYLVHDAWGHTWQEVLNEFEWEYALLRAASEPLSPADGPTFGGAETAPLGAAFGAHEGVSVLDEERLLQSAEADLRGRIQVGLSAALSEVLADFVEAKFSRLNPEHRLPTSSLLDANSLKFDLTVQDVLRQARRWSAPYREFCSDATRQRLFFERLLQLGLPEAGLESCLERARVALDARFGSALRPVLSAGPADPLGTTVATRALLKLAQLSRALEHVLSETAAWRSTPAWTHPAYCPDLWAVSVSHLYEADRQTRFWQLDWLVRNSLQRACEALGSELARDPG